MSAYYCCLLALVVAAGSPDPNRGDWKYRNACGPISLWVACRVQGSEVTLDDVCNRCGFRNGEPTSIGAIRDAMKGSWLLKAEALKMSPAELKRKLACGNPVVLFVRGRGSREIDHAVCAVKFERNEYTVVDYPEVTRTMGAARLLEIWDGHSVVVRPTFLGSFIRQFDVIVCSSLILALVLWSLRWMVLTGRQCEDEFRTRVPV